MEANRLSYGHYNSQTSPAIATTSRHYSGYVRHAALILGQLIKLGRKEKRWTEAELAQRAGISRSTLKKIEKGHLKCEIGIVFEVASLTGVHLFAPDRAKISTDVDLVKQRLALLPKRIIKSKAVDDDFWQRSSPKGFCVDLATRKYRADCRGAQRRSSTPGTGCKKGRLAH